MPGWDTLKNLLVLELRQLEEEGRDTKSWKHRLEKARDDDGKLNELYSELESIALPVREDFLYEEPNGIQEIRALRPEGPKLASMNPASSEMKDRMYGAWFGRVIGCALGKPLECGVFSDGSNGKSGPENIKLWFEGADAWPISGYTPLHSRAEEQGLALPPYGLRSTREAIRYMESDDDIRYTVLGLILLEEKGLDWDAWDVGKLWHNRLTYSQVCTAETQAYHNFASVTSHMNADKTRWREQQHWVRTFRNPYREWIGAQIRVDSYGYAAAGNPELAAELAWRDASFSHVKNGIYGAMFIAAMIAAAFIETDPLTIVQTGLSQIPATSRLAHDVRQAIGIARHCSTQMELADAIWEAYGHYHWVHTNNNAALIAAALVFSEGDFETAVTTAVLGGWDTDCNGASIGSIAGAMAGADRIPAHWKLPLGDTLYSEVHGFDPIAISACARRSLDVFYKLNKYTD